MSERPPAEVRGTEPPGSHDEKSAARAVERMFSAIAPRYDLLNHVLSLNVDRLWWRRTARTFAAIVQRPGGRILDLCCGTCDMALALRQQGREARIIGADFSHPMLEIASRKVDGRRIEVIQGDALQLPFAAGSFDLVVSSFGFRNLANYDAGLREIHRVLGADGELGILDFSEPKGFFGSLYRLYFRHVLPRVGSLISGVKGPYAYLPASVARFPASDIMLTRMAAVGFRDVSWTPYTLGIAGLFRGRK